MRVSYKFPPFKFLNTIVVITLAKKGPMHGYALTSEIEDKLGLKPSQTAIYNILKSLEETGVVTSEERIENGRVQKIYTITSKGLTLHEEHKKRFKAQIAKMSALVTGAIENMHENSAQTELHTLFQDLRQFPLLVMTLINPLPKETQEIISTAVKSLSDLAKAHNIPLPSKDEEFGFPCPDFMESN